MRVSSRVGVALILAVSLAYLSPTSTQAQSPQSQTAREKRLAAQYLAIENHFKVLLDTPLATYTEEARAANAKDELRLRCKAKIPITIF